MLVEISVISILSTWKVKLILHVTDIYVEQYGTQYGALRYTKIDFFRDGIYYYGFVRIVIYH